MPVYPLTPLRPLKFGHYPHMAKHDAVIWERFLDLYAPRLAAVAYDVALGGVVIDAALGDEAARLGWQYDTALKVDAVALLERECWIIEVRPRAGVSALGAALCYLKMAERDTFTTRALTPVVVTDATTPDIRFCAEALRVTLLEVGAAVSGPPLEALSRQAGVA